MLRFKPTSLGAFIKFVAQSLEMLVAWCSMLEKKKDIA
jgi:hypothetical protein